MYNFRGALTDVLAKAEALLQMMSLWGYRMADYYSNAIVVKHPEPVKLFSKLNKCWIV